jgi:succinate-semialdehyde dehydrogenase/glutarate-semialdehyde dehydrogenase
MGPLINDIEARRVASLVQGAEAQGAVRTGASPSVAVTGAFHPPVVLAGVTAEMDIAHEEIFGPVAPVIRFHGEAEALRIANDTQFGLAAYVYTADATRQWRLMERLEYGMVGVNDGLIATEVAPFG